VHRIVGGFEVRAVARGFALDASQRELAVDAVGNALVGQIQEILGALQLILREVALCVRTGKPEVRLHHVGRKFQARGLRVDFRRARIADRGLPGGALAAPQVDVPFETEVAVPDHAEVSGRQRRQDRRNARARDTRATIQRRLARGIGGTGRGQRRAHARIDQRHVGIVGERFVHQLVELRIPDGLPPVLMRPRAGVDLHAAKTLLGMQAARLRGRRSGTQATRAGATGEDGGRQRDGEAETMSGNLEGHGVGRKS